LLDQVKEVCAHLAKKGWHDLLLQFGLDITANDLKKELLKDLPNIDRSIDGFQDFSLEGHRGLEPGCPARSLLYHALASPNVIRGVNGMEFGPEKFPDLSEIECVENYVFGIEAPSVQDLDAQAKDIAAKVKQSTGQSQDAFMAVVVFATEYRSASQTTHQNHADLCFSRTGVSRVGNRPVKYDPKRRGFLPFHDDDYEFRVLPTKFSSYIAVQLTGEKNIFGPMRFGLGDGKDESRKFWVPLHKLFSGSECIQGLDLNIVLNTFHVNEKIKRIHLQLETIPGYPATDRSILENPPYRFTTGIAELSTDTKSVPGLVVPTVYKELVEPAVFEGKNLSFLVPMYSQLNASNVISYTWAPSLQINDENGARHAPEFVHIRHKLQSDGTIQSLNDTNDVISAVKNSSGYYAQHYIDFTGDGWIIASCPQLVTDFPRQPIPAYSLVTSPDFFPAVDQGELMDWYIQKVPKALQDIWYSPDSGNKTGNLKTLSDERMAPNIELNTSEKYPFRREDDSVTAIVSLPIIGPSSKRPFLSQETIRSSYLPDAASGVFAPGWDISFDHTKGVNHLAAYGLGSPFPEDSKLCAALSSFWPAVSPDTGRSFWQPDNIDDSPVYPTVSPLTDEEIGQVGNISWDGSNGPRSIDLGDGKESIEYSKFEFIDYVENMIQKKFSMALTSKIGLKQYKSRILAMARAYKSCNIEANPNLNEDIPKDKFHWPVTSFYNLSFADGELQQAQIQAGAMIVGDLYRIEICLCKRKQQIPADHKKVYVEILEKYTCFVGSENKVLVKHDNDPWKLVIPE